MPRDFEFVSLSAACLPRIDIREHDQQIDCINKDKQDDIVIV